MAFLLSSIPSLSSTEGIKYLLTAWPTIPAAIGAKIKPSGGGNIPTIPPVRAIAAVDTNPSLIPKPKAPAAVPCLANDAFLFSSSLAICLALACA